MQETISFSAKKIYPIISIIIMIILPIAYIFLFGFNSAATWLVFALALPVIFFSFRTIFYSSSVLAFSQFGIITMEGN